MPGRTQDRAPVRTGDKAPSRKGRGQGVDYDRKRGARKGRGQGAGYNRGLGKTGCQVENRTGRQQGTGDRT